MYKSILHSKHSLPQTCSGHLCGNLQTGVLQRMDITRYYKNIWTNSQKYNLYLYFIF